MSAPVLPSQPMPARLRRTASFITSQTGDEARWIHEAADRIEELELGFASIAFAMGWTDLKGMSVEQYAVTLKARAEQADRAVEVLESNARVQAKLLADTGRRVEEMGLILGAARQALEYSIDMGGTDPGGVLLQTLNKIDRTLSKPAGETGE